MSLFGAGRVSDLVRFWREMAAVPGRMAASLRFALTTSFAALLLLILQPPLYAIAPSLFMLFLISHDTPENCLKDLVACLSGAALGTAAALLLVMATGNDPAARVLGLAVFTFLATFFFRASTQPLLALSFGCLTYMVISLWENQIPAEKVLHLSLWPMGTLGTVAACALAVDYLFNRSDPLAGLRREIRARCSAVEQLFQLLATHSDAGLIERQSAIVRRYAVTGEGCLHVLLERISKSKTCSDADLKQLKTVILMLDRLLILAAGMAVHEGLDAAEASRLERLSKALAAAGLGRMDQIQAILGDSESPLPGELDIFERTLRHAGAPLKASVSKPLRTQPRGAPWKDIFKHLLLPDGFTNSDYFVYALKMSLCATTAYVIYNGLKWPGISTAFFTVYFTGLSTTGASNRKLLFRVIGSAIGGMILGIGCLVFVFPNLESVTGFLLVIAAVSLLGAWISASSYFGYIGLQIVFSFNLLAFERFHAPDQMTPARDRLLGISLSFILMFLVFHQVRPERTVDAMRRLLARLLRAGAELTRLSGVESGDDGVARVTAIRRQIEIMIPTLQSFADVVKFEFDPDRAADLRASAEIQNALTSATDVVLGIRTWSPTFDAAEQNPELREIRDALENGLRGIASFLEQHPGEQLPATEEILIEQRLNTLPIAVAKTLDNYRELKMICDGIARCAA